MITYLCENNDIPNVCGVDNFPDFREHRHDQSVLSLLSVKHKLEIFRDPSQYGKYLKMPEFREKGEFLPEPYKDSVYLNSPYQTLINWHRERHQTFNIKIRRKIRHIIKKMPGR